MPPEARDERQHRQARGRSTRAARLPRRRDHVLADVRAPRWPSARTTPSSEWSSSSSNAATSPPAAVCWPATAHREGRPHPTSAATRSPTDRARRRLLDGLALARRARAPAQRLPDRLEGQSRLAVETSLEKLKASPSRGTTSASPSTWSHSRWRASSWVAAARSRRSTRAPGESSSSTPLRATTRTVWNGTSLDLEADW